MENLTLESYEAKIAELDDFDAETWKEEMGAWSQRNPDVIDAWKHILMAPPSASRDQSLDPRTCSYCGKASATKLSCCSRCKKQAYCNRSCQRKHWKKQHERECVKIEELPTEDRKRLPLSWEQLEVLGEGKSKHELEVRLQGFSGPRYHCYDRQLKRRDVLVPRSLHNLLVSIFDKYQTVVIVWKRPISRTQIDQHGETNMIILEDDLQNITVEGNGPRSDPCSEVSETFSLQKLTGNELQESKESTEASSGQSRKSQATQTLHTLAADKDEDKAVKEDTPTKQCHGITFPFVVIVAAILWKSIFMS